MGRNANIKRLKKLKQLKKQKQKEAEINLQYESHIKELQDKNKSLGFEVRLNTDKLKYSDLLIQFVSPELEGWEDEETLREILFMGVVSWNLGLTKLWNPVQFENMYNEVASKAKSHESELEVINGYIDRKINEFADYEFLFHDFSLKSIGGKFHITVSGTKWMTKRMEQINAFEPHRIYGKWISNIK